MKVQKKGLSWCQANTYELVQETDRFYICLGACLGTYSAFRKEEYELVHEWVDRTDEGYTGIQVVVPGLTEFEWRLQEGKQGYRLLSRLKS